MTADAARLEQGLRSWAQQVQIRAGYRMPDAIRATGLVPRDEGVLERNIRTMGGTTSTGTSFHTRVVAATIQAVTTDKGARPHVIRPRRAAVLRFPSSGGGIVFARKVNHPGNPPRPWWQKAVTRAYQETLREAARSVPFR